MRLMELVHEEERVECKKISVGVYILKNTYEESHAWFKEKKMMRMKGKEWGEKKEKGMMRC